MSEPGHIVGDLDEVMAPGLGPLPRPPSHVLELPIFAVLGRDGYIAVGGPMGPDAERGQARQAGIVLSIHVPEPKTFDGLENSDGVVANIIAQFPALP